MTGHKFKVGDRIWIDLPADDPWLSDPPLMKTGVIVVANQERWAYSGRGNPKSDPMFSYGIRFDNYAYSDSGEYHTADEAIVRLEAVPPVTDQEIAETFGTFDYEDHQRRTNESAARAWSYLWAWKVQRDIGDDRLVELLSRIEWTDDVFVGYDGYIPGSWSIMREVCNDLPEHLYERIMKAREQNK